jgi:hypothetical protein
MGKCSDFSDIFYLPGDRLSSTGAVQHSINVEEGTHPFNTISYRLPEAQEGEVRKQVQNRIQEGIREESSSLWNSPILIIPIKVDASEQQMFWLVVVYRKLNEKTLGNSCPLPDSTDILEQIGLPRSSYWLPPN